jgi:glucosamine--fructose-6-phosphate aminotransferase (isomerizing)
VTLPRLRGAFALGFLFSGEDDLLIGARHGAPLAIGYGNGEMFLGSDALALAPFTDEITYLEDGDSALLRRSGVVIHDASGRTVDRHRTRILTNSLIADKGNHRHFMAKEIHEQPEVVGRTLAHYVNFAAGRVELPFDLPFDFKDLRPDFNLGLRHGLSRGLISKYWFERLARIPVEIDVASEFRYREAPLEPGGLGTVRIAVRRDGGHAGVAALCCGEWAAHPISRERPDLNDGAGKCGCGPDSRRRRGWGGIDEGRSPCQLSVLLCLAVAAGRARGTLTEDAEKELLDALMNVPGLINEAIKREPQIEVLSRELSKAKDVLYLGRGTAYPLAMEGRAEAQGDLLHPREGYAAGELKHGPIALIDETMPVIVIAPHDNIFEKTVSNMQEVAARGGRIILITDEKGALEAGLDTMATIVMPSVHPIVAPIIHAIPIQLLAYHTAAVMGKDVDQPRNLANP